MTHNQNPHMPLFSRCPVVAQLLFSQTLNNNGTTIGQPANNDITGCLQAVKINMLKFFSLYDRNYVSLLIGQNCAIKLNTLTVK